MPLHNHAPQVSTDVATQASPAGHVMAKSGYSDGQGNTGQVSTFSSQAAETPLNFQALSITGGGLPHNNLQPYLALNFCIALQGIFPPRP
jgi:microcystin-dependent protein